MKARVTVYGRGSGKLDINGEDMRFFKLIQDREQVCVCGLEILTSSCLLFIYSLYLLFWINCILCFHVGLSVCLCSFSPSADCVSAAVHGSVG